MSDTIIKKARNHLILKKAYYILKKLVYFLGFSQIIKKARNHLILKKAYYILKKLVYFLGFSQIVTSFILFKSGRICSLSVNPVLPVKSNLSKVEHRFIVPHVFLLYF